MAGLISVIAFDELWRVSKYLYYGMIASQNRGQDKYVAALSNGRGLHVVEGDVPSLYVGNSDLLKAKGHVGIGATFTSSEPYNSKYTHLEKDGIGLVVVVDGLVSKPLAELCESVLSGLRSGRSLAEAFTEAASRFYGTYSLVAMSSRGEVVAYRSPPGLRPLHLGSCGFDMALVASETAPIAVLGGEPKRRVTPGELVYMTPELIKFTRVHDVTKPTLCSFEYVYTARHDSVLDNIDVYHVRKSLGVRLANRFRREVDIVVGVPDTAIPYAIGFARALGRELDLGFVPTGHRFRAAVRKDPRERLIGVQLKLNPIRCVYSGKRVAVVDDSLVRGVTMKYTAQTLRNRLGAKEVHVVIGSPKLSFSCPYGVDLPGSDELLAANLDEELSVKYLEVDSLTWLNAEDLSELFSEYGVSVCLGCFLGEYPVGWST